MPLTFDPDYLEFEEQASAPATPSTGNWLLYAKAAGLFVRDDAGVETQLGTGGGMTNFNVAADSGTPATIDDAETLTIAGGTGVSTSVSGNTVTINNAWDYEEILGGTGAFDVTLSSISTWDSNVKTIIIEVGLRSTVSATSDDIYILFNNDTTAGNYHRQLNGVVDGIASVAENAVPLIMRSTGATSTASSFATGKITIAMPNSTSYLKSAKVESQAYLTTAAMVVDNGAVYWVTGGTAAITRIQIRTDNHPTEQFAANSYIRMMFIK